MNILIRGKYIDLKELDESDIEQIRLWRNSKDVSEFMLSRNIISKEQQQKWYEDVIKGKKGVCWVILSKQGKRLGLVSLGKINNIEKTAEPGLYIGRKEDRNSLFGMEAYFFLLNYAFVKIGLEKIYGTVLSNNKVAVKMNNSFGFREKEILQGVFQVKSGNLDVYKIELTKENYYKSPMYRFFHKASNGL